MVGAKATNALSEFFKVTSFREGKKAQIEFERGIKKKFTVGKNDNPEMKTGTIVQFLPDIQIFKNGIEVDYDKLKKQVQELSFLSPKMTFLLSYKDKPAEKFYSENGISDYINMLTKSKVTTKKFYTETFDERIGVKLTFCYTNTYTDTYRIFTNNIPNTGGTHLTGFRSALTQAVNEFARENKLLKEKDVNLTGEELKEGLVLVLSYIMPDPVFNGQTKEVLTSGEARTIVQRLCLNEIKDWLSSNPKDGKFIVDKALLARKAREKARKAKEAVRETKQSKNQRIVMPGILADCNSEKRKKCEIFLVEGRSASGTVKEARDRETQAVLSLKGKPINVLKSDLSKSLNNNEIKSMINAFGLILNEKAIIFDESKLRYGKIILASDAE